jgi:putative endonuclease
MEAGCTEDPREYGLDDPSALGRRGEEAAALYLSRRWGMSVVTRNWRCREGEIDLVLTEGSTLVFCEVKTRRGHGYGYPLEAITYRKRARLRRLVSAYLQQTGGHDGPIRLDAVGIEWLGPARMTVRVLRGID